VGFALETEHPEKYAVEKLKRKNLDAVVLNVVSENSGFKSNTNKIKIFDKKDRIFESSVQSKDQIAVILLNTLNDWLF
jgi:phosphopantothenoylcysteine decarboxylase/phosphopantothenate--cysteine ligase